MAWSDSVLLTLRSLVCRWKTCRKGGQFLLSLFTACSLKLGTKRNYKVVEEKLLGFVLVYKYKLVPSCTEATVLLNVYPVFVSKFDFDCESNIR